MPEQADGRQHHLVAPALTRPPYSSYYYCHYYLAGTSESDVQDTAGTIELMDGWFFPNQELSWTQDVPLAPSRCRYHGEVGQQ